jgi:hypothetical protein
MKEKVKMEPDISSNFLMQEIENYFVPAYQENNILIYWEDNKQVTSNGTVRNISDIAIDFQTLSIRLETLLSGQSEGTPTPKITEFSKKQACTVAIYAALQLEIEPNIDTDLIS